MNSFLNLFKGEPEFVNELGVKWWRDTDTTEYAQKEDRNGISLDVVCFGVEFPNGSRTRVLVSREGEVIEDDQNLEALATKIDVRKFLKHDLAKNP